MRKVISLVSLAIAAVSTLFATTSSTWFLNRPEVPTELKRTK